MQTDKLFDSYALQSSWLLIKKTENKCWEGLDNQKKHNAPEAEKTIVLPLHILLLRRTLLLIVLFMAATDQKF